MEVLIALSSVLIAVTSAWPWVGASGHFWLAELQLSVLSMTKMMFGALTVVPWAPRKISMSSARTVDDSKALRVSVSAETVNLQRWFILIFPITDKRWTTA